MHILIIDAGSQYTKIIDKKLRKININTIIGDNITPNTSGIIISGGPRSVYNSNIINCDIFNSNIPILGICYGMQLINQYFGGTVTKSNIREDGECKVELSTDNSIFSGLNNIENVLLTHGDSVDKLGDNLQVIGKSENHISAIKHNKLDIFGLQFHPEVDITENGLTILENFAFHICKMDPVYTVDDCIDNIIYEIRNKVGKKQVKVLLSGGVDSTVCYALIHKALGPEKVTGIHINNGFLRMNESKIIYKLLKDIGFDINVIDATDIFCNAKTFINNVEVGPLKDIKDPELKRIIIGDTFMRIVEKYIGENDIICQGTLRSDLIESASSYVSANADKIKTHHNDSPIVREKRELGLIIEPLKDFHKDEVKQIGYKLGLPNKLLNRHPFPGPGLAIRIICNTENECKDNILPVKSVGIQGDIRTYANPLYVHDDNDYTHYLQTNPDINRIVKILYPKNRLAKPLIIETNLSKSNIMLLQEIDEIVYSTLVEFDIYDKISQIPVILLPITFDGVNRSIVIRPVITNDFMTGKVYKLDNNLLDILIRRIIGTGKISGVLYDMTSKPPGTIEWE